MQTHLRNLKKEEIKPNTVVLAQNAQSRLNVRSKILYIIIQMNANLATSLKRAKKITTITHQPKRNNEKKTATIQIQ